jgi:hypothetical protein
MKSLSRLALSLGLLSLFSLPFIGKTKAEPILSVVPAQCLSQFPAGANPTLSAAYVANKRNRMGTTPVPFVIATYTDGEAGGQKLLLYGNLECSTLGTDNTVFPLSQWKNPNITADVVKGLALDEAKRWVKAHPEVSSVSSEYLAPEQVIAYKSLGIKVQ